MKKITMNNQRGSIINIALLILLIMTVIGLAVNRSSNVDTKISSNEKLSKLALYAAEAGVERALAIMEDAGADKTWLAAAQTFGDASYTVTITDLTGNPIIAPEEEASSSAPSSSTPSSSTPSSSAIESIRAMWDKLAGFFVSPAYADSSSTPSSSTPSSSSSTPTSLLEDEDLDGDGYVLITATGSINGVTRTIEVIYNQDEGRISYREVK